MRHGRLASMAMVAVIALFGLSATSAHAAYFTATPFELQRSGAGPFEWRFASSNPGGSNGSFAYKLSTEDGWHRCGKDYPPRLESVSDGVYSVTIADDISLDWYAARGLLYSGATQPCHENHTTAPNTAPTTHTIVVDGTPPTVSEPNVVVSGLNALVSVSASDAVAGIERVDWSLGDGVTVSGDRLYVQHTYLRYGTYSGSVTISDGVGNQTRRTFTAAVPPPPSPAVGPTPVADQQPPVIEAVGARRQRVGRRGVLRLRYEASEDCAVVVTGNVSARGRKYRLKPVQASLVQGAARTLKLRAPRRVRRAIRAALKRKKRVTAHVRVAATDAAGNRQTRRFRIRVVG